MLHKGIKCLKGAVIENSTIWPLLCLCVEPVVCSLSVLVPGLQGTLHNYAIIFPSRLSLPDRHKRRNTGPNKVMIMTCSSLLIILFVAPCLSKLSLSVRIITSWFAFAPNVVCCLSMSSFPQLWEYKHALICCVYLHVLSLQCKHMHMCVCLRTALL